MQKNIISSNCHFDKHESKNQTLSGVSMGVHPSNTLKVFWVVIGGTSPFLAGDPRELQDPLLF
jgi:hypothetical protein